MSSPVGTPANFVDTQKMQVENVTDSLIYTQVLQVMPAEIDHSMEINFRTDDFVEKLYSLENVAYEIRMLVTEPEYVALTNLAIMTNAQLPIKTWTLTMTSQSNLPATLTGEARMRRIRLIDPGIGALEIAFRLEFESGTTEAVVVPA